MIDQTILTDEKITKVTLNIRSNCRKTFMKLRISSNGRKNTNNVNEIFFGSFSTDLSFTQIKNPPIDTGSTNSIINPAIAEQFFPLNHLSLYDKN